jgi:hypothetical protein
MRQPYVTSSSNLSSLWSSIQSGLERETQNKLGSPYFLTVIWGVNWIHPLFHAANW